MENIFTYEAQDLDLKESTKKLKTSCQQLDTIILQFNIYNYDNPVDLTNFNIEFTAIKPDGTVYIQTENMTKVGNLLTISCNNQISAVNGKVNSILTIFDNLGNQISSYFIVLNVSGLIADENSSRNFVDILEQLNTSINQAIQINENFDNDIEDANTLDIAFKESIVNASTNKVALDNSNTIALDTKSIIDTSISNANIINNTLTDKNAESNLLIPRVTSINDASQITKANLQTLIDTSETKLQEFENFDTNQIIVKTNEIYNEMFAINELLIIEHNLNATPLVQFIIVNEGYGKGGFGQTSYGGVSECGLGTYKVRYYSKNKLSIVVSNNYYKENPIIAKVNDYEYNVSFENVSKTMLIKLLLV